MTVRTKFKCWSIIPGQSANPDDVCAEVRFQAAYGDGKTDNAEWSKWAPSGEIRMFITNPVAVEAFEVGKSYYLTFEAEHEA